MPEKLRVVSYLVGASLATAALIYIIGPDHVLPSTSAVGLSNRANDCFINSVLQALAGLPELREYLIRETHRRAIDPAVYEDELAPYPFPPRASRKNVGSGGNGAEARRAMPEWKVRGLQEGLVTRGLKAMVDALNEKARVRKSIDPAGFVDVLQEAFRQHISRQQQDAHEFLQIIAERLKEEYTAGRAARLYHAELLDGGFLGRRPNGVDGRDEGEGEDDDGEGKWEGEREGERGGRDNGIPAIQFDGSSDNAAQIQPRAGGPDNKPDNPNIDSDNDDDDEQDDGGFPMQGRIESQIECKTCGYRTKPRQEDFYILTLNVPHQLRNTTLDECFAQQFRKEEIDDYRCDKCRLVHLRDRLARDSSPNPTTAQADELAQLDHAIAHDPESLPDGTPLTRGWDKAVPKRSIVRSSRISRHPRVLVVHLSRSIFAGGSQKNAAKVAFPERLDRGSLMKPCWYRLLAVVMHRGSHDSGHYDSFRRQATAAVPYPNKTAFRPSGVYSRTASRAASRNPSRAASPSRTTSSSPPQESSPTNLIQGTRQGPTEDGNRERDLLSPPRPSHVTTQTSPSSSSPPSSRTSVSDPDQSPPSSDTSPPTSHDTPSPPPSAKPKSKKSKHKPPKGADKWWRISDEKVKEARTAEVLGVQREAYMLFYELEKPVVATTAAVAAASVSVPALVERAAKRRRMAGSTATL